MSELKADARDGRSRRKRPVRPRTLSVRDTTRRELALGRTLYPDVDDVVRPAVRGDCANGQRPCAFVACKHHLYLDVDPKTGSLKLNFPDLEVWEMAESCSLDVADRDGITLEELGNLMNMTRERARQLEAAACSRLHRTARSLGEDHYPKRRLALLMTRAR